ncbi:hypothetical protein FTV88_1446 [Heliorestis convoluta]|uniref:Uncharacterized protein n=1 Tax=Heliorestis convoluta TaxID=356322 RepID=A0A5Q2N1A8_9FIRM|nr:hypothetical protein FTV88_1446 [Heliorestis convoluta]
MIERPVSQSAGLQVFFLLLFLEQGYSLLFSLKLFWLKDS